jgi:pyruvate kinase
VLHFSTATRCTFQPPFTRILKGSLSARVTAVEQVANMGNRANPVYTQTRRLSGQPAVAGRLHLSADKPIIAQRATELIEPLARIHADMLEAPCLHRAELEVVHPRNLRSALNLLQYLALRRHNLGEVQARLAELGLSSLGRSEAHALTTLQAVMHALYALFGRSEPPFQTDAVGFVEGSRLLRAHADELLVASPEGRNTRIMVTMPSEAADDYELVHALVRNGMDVMRINCAHDDTAKWKRMARNL